MKKIIIFLNYLLAASILVSITFGGASNDAWELFLEISYFAFIPAVIAFFLHMHLSNRNNVTKNVEPLPETQEKGKFFEKLGKGFVYFGFPILLFWIIYTYFSASSEGQGWMIYSLLIFVPGVLFAGIIPFIVHSDSDNSERKEAATFPAIPENLNAPQPQDDRPPFGLFLVLIIAFSLSLLGPELKNFMYTFNYILSN